MVGILNRHINGQTFPAADARSRGLLCMDLLAASIRSGCRSFHATIITRATIPLLLLFADQNEAFVSYNAGREDRHPEASSRTSCFQQRRGIRLAFGQGRSRLRAIRRRENHDAAWMRRSQRTPSRHCKALGDHSLPARLCRPGRCHLRASGQLRHGVFEYCLFCRTAVSIRYVLLCGRALPKFFRRRARHSTSSERPSKSAAGRHGNLAAGGGAERF